MAGHPMFSKRTSTGCFCHTEVCKSLCFSQACVCCEDPTNPFWQPESLPGFNLTCTCGLHPIEVKKQKPEQSLSDATHHSVKHVPTEPGVNTSSNKRSRSNSACYSKQEAPFMPVSKRQCMTPMDKPDVKLSPSQTEYFTVERHHDASGNVLGWTITDCTIHDTRHFQMLMHAQSFIEECWAFVSTDLRYFSLASADTAKCIRNVLLLLTHLYAGTHSCEFLYSSSW